MNLYVIFVLSIISSVNPDSVIRGVYINPYQASKKDYLAKVFAAADSGLINTIVVDFKSDYGFLAYPSKLDLPKKIGAVKRYIDTEYLVKNAALHNVKLIARVVCFRDNYLAQYKNYAILNDQGGIWKDKKGLAWVNPYIDGVADYLISIVQELISMGIKSIALDYVRFPTDGEIEKIRLTNVTGPRREPIINLLKKIRTTVKAEIGTCIFGYAVWYDLKFEGQNIEEFGEYVDIIYPMLYPSHFHPDFEKMANEYWRNYWIYFNAVQAAFKKLPVSVSVVPFVQNFDLRAENFNAQYISSQINGTMTAHADGFILWNARGNYATSWPSLLEARSLTLKKSFLRNPNNHREDRGRRYQDIDLY